MAADDQGIGLTVTIPKFTANLDGLVQVVVDIGIAPLDLGPLHRMDDGIAGDKGLLATLS